MVKVKLLGVLRIQLKKSYIEIEATTINEVLDYIHKTSDDVTIKELKKSVIFVNGKNIIELNMFRTKLMNNDEVILMAPVCGG